MTLLQMPSPLNIRDKAQEGVLQGVPDTAYDPDTTGGTLLGNIIVNLLSLAIVIGTIAAFAFLIIGAIEWITSGGDKGKTDKAREKITGSIIGLVILSSTIAVFILIQRFLGINVLPFTSTYTAPVDLPNTATCYDYASKATCNAAGCTWSVSGCRP